MINVGKDIFDLMLSSAKRADSHDINARLVNCLTQRKRSYLRFMFWVWQPGWTTNLSTEGEVVDIPLKCQ